VQFDANSHHPLGCRMLQNASKSLEAWIWDAACSIRGAKDAPKFKDFILPLIFAKRLCDVFDDEIDRIAKEVRSRAKAFQLVKHDKSWFVSTSP
jgi:type I restriction enzyme M protein